MAMGERNELRFYSADRIDESVGMNTACTSNLFFNFGWNGEWVLLHGSY